MPRLKIEEHNCATELKSVLDRVMQENYMIKGDKQALLDENSRLLQLVENTAEKIENMEALIEA